MIEVGEYVRTKTGYIGIVENINDFRPPEAKICVDFNVPDLIFLGKTDIIKHSKNIIDLVEVGDYVNGEKIEQITTDSGYKKYHTTGFGLYDEYDNENVIHSILTKEQYEANCYKVKEE